MGHYWKTNVIWCLVIYYPVARCRGSYISIGCFTDVANPRAMPKEIATYRGQTDRISKCANKAKELGYQAFGVQYGGQCWSGPQAQQTYAIHGYSSNCNNGIGGAWANAVYIFEAVLPTFPAPRKEAVQGDVRLDMFPYLCAVAVLLLLSFFFRVLLFRLRRGSKNNEQRIQFINTPKDEHRMKDAERRKEDNRPDSCSNEKYIKNQDILPLSHRDSDTYQALDFGPTKSSSSNNKKIEPSYESMNENESTEYYLEVIP